MLLGLMGAPHLVYEVSWEGRNLGNEEELSLLPKKKENRSIGSNDRSFHFSTNLKGINNPCLRLMPSHYLVIFLWRFSLAIAFKN